MAEALRLLAVLAHPDDEAMAVGGVIAKYAAEGIEVSLIVATRGQRGRFHGHPQGDPRHPGPEALAQIRQEELDAAATVLGIRDVTVLEYEDQLLDKVDPSDAIGQIAHHIRRLRPQVVVTFGPDGTYGHPDHIAISQLTAGAIVAAAAGATHDGPHRAAHEVSKFYYLVWSQEMLDAFDRAYHRLVSRVDDAERRVVAWPEWQITTVVDTREQWPIVWRAVSCHQTQVNAYERLMHLPDEEHSALWGRQCFYRVFSRVNGGRVREQDLFEGLRNRGESVI
jgi:LmbE family N-acetylglucosaminyl deacetylase